MVPVWVTVNVDSAIVSVPTRFVVPEYACTLEVTLPGPVPAAPAVIAIQGALLMAVHAQPAAIVTAATISVSAVGLVTVAAVRGVVQVPVAAL